jgi:UDP-2,4-diacetamido-2,4,6-trideoxy-beta-L-altropyranose hydrolase
MTMKTASLSLLNRLHFVFRMDAGNAFGNGHFMRCLVLTTELRKRGHLVTVLSRQIPDHLQYSLTNLGIRAFYISLDSDGLTELSEINKLNRIDWLVIDHYGIDAIWENQARRFVSRVMVIDDLANRQHNCDILLDQNIPNCLQKEYTKLIPEHCVQAIGLSYLLARPSFYNRIVKARSGTLVFLGGGDHSQALLRLLNQLLKLTFYHPLRVLVSSDYLPLDRWQSMVGECGQVHCDLADPTSLYRSVEIAVVRCGFVSYELALLGIPAIQIHATSIQAEVAVHLESNGMGVALDELHLPNSVILNAALQKVSSISPAPLNEHLTPGASVVAEILEQNYEHK